MQTLNESAHLDQVGRADAAIARYLSWLGHIRGASAHTLRSYERALRDLPMFLAHRMGTGGTWDDVGQARVRGYLSDVAPPTGSPATRRARLAAIRAFWGWLVREGLATYNAAAAIAAPSDSSAARWIPSVEQVRRVLELPGRLTRGLVGPALWARDSAMLEILYATGMRVGELCGIRISELDHARRNVRVVGKGGVERVCLYGRPAAAAVVAYIEEHRHALLPYRLSGRTPPELVAPLWLTRCGGRVQPGDVRRALRARCLAAGIRAITPHLLRHAMATHLLAAGADIRTIQELLGHATISTTERYTHLGLDELREQYERAHPLCKERLAHVPAGDPPLSGLAGGPESGDDDG